MEIDEQLRREDLKLYDLYPKEYVAWIDIWRVQGETRLLERRILAHSQDPKTLSDKLEVVLSQGQITRESVRSVYIEDPHDGVPDRYTIGE